MDDDDRRALRQLDRAASWDRMVAPQPSPAPTVAALYVAKDGCYFGLPGVDPWDEARDARAYAGSLPVVAHPPCSTWSCLAPINEKRYGHAIGSDGGCFAAALSSVRRCGGVLEHPALSRAWAAYVSQAAYGHRAAKMTRLYYVGSAAPPPLRWERPAPTAIVSNLANHPVANLPRLSPRETKATPPAFRDLLLDIARGAHAQ